MKKVLSLALALCMLLALGLSACGTTQTTQEEETTTTTTEEAKRVEPLPADESLSNPTDADVAASFNPSDIREEDGQLVMEFTVYDYELFDSADISTLAVGDTIVIDGTDMVVTSREDTEGGYIVINDGLDQGGVDLAPGEGGTYYSMGLDDAKDYQEVATIKLPVDPNCVLTDNSDLENPNQQMAISEVQSMSDEEAHFIPHNTVIHIENGTVTGITLNYIP